LLALPPSLDRSALESGLSGRYALELQDLATQTRQHHDTFDWRLWRKGLRLYRTERHYVLESTGDASGVIATAPARPARFASELPAGPLRRTLAPVLEMRALLRLVDLTLAVQRFSLKGRRGQTVLRGAFLDVAAERKRASRITAPFLLLEPVKDKGKALRRVTGALADLGVPDEPVDLLDWTAGRLGLQPGGYRTRVRVDLTADTPAREALHAILRRQLWVLHQNEAGVVADVDTEFLHDLRVAARRTHVVLTRYRGVLPPAVHTHFGRGFAGLRSATGPLRDLDVYLLDEARYRGLVAQDLKGGLDLLFAQLRAERRGEHARVARILRSDAYRDFRDHWQRYLAGDDAASTVPSAEGDLPMGEVAGRVIARQARRVARRAARLEVGSPDEELHRLRIHIKKLRYLLEFAGGLLPAGRTRPLVGRLKSLQTSLGRCNDLSVQREFLRLRLEKSPGTDRPASLTAAAIGGLMAALDAQQRGARQVFLAANTAFLAEGGLDDLPRP
jgi:CHAD domain-containing protein